MSTRRIDWRQALTTAAFVATVGLAHAGPIYVENGDAGDTLATAQDTVGSGPLQAIRGTLTGGVDLYRIFLDGGGTFAATTTLSTITFNAFDTTLYLFGDTGLGVYANDDDPFFGPQSTLPAFDPLTPLAPGYYYLAITGAGVLPSSAAGSIFPSLGGLLDGTSDVLGPSGPGGGLPLIGWDGVSSETGAYEIALAGAQFATVPEPSGAALVAVALLAAFVACRGSGRRKVHAVGLATLLVASMAHAQYAHLDAALSDIVDGGTASGDPAHPWVGSATIHQDRAQLDATGERLLVDLYLDPASTSSVTQFASWIEGLGGLVVAVDGDVPGGALAAYVPFDRILSASSLQGLHVMALADAPERRAGLVTSQGTRVIRSSMANGSGIRGAGITVGAISDSFDRNLLAKTSAAQDVQSGDLLALKTREREYVLLNGDWSDEGRAMLQLVHDVAPEADLCFASGWGTEIAMASAIEWLRTGDCKADVIVDDLGFADAPVFSDGPAATKVDKVVTSATLAGRPVVYVSAAGNRAGEEFKGSVDLPQASFQALPPALAAAIDLSTCVVTPGHGASAADTAGGWLSFGQDAAGQPMFLQRITVATTGLLTLQWDDPFRRKGMTADLNVFLLDAAGRCRVAYATNNFTEDRAIELLPLPMPWLQPAGGVFQGWVMVARTAVGARSGMNVPVAVRLSYWRGGVAMPALGQRSSPTVFGHAAAARAIAVAAYRYTSAPPVAPPAPYTPVLETFSSVGPVRIAFDAAGRRLASAEVRKKPDLAGPDRVDTTFFPEDPTGLPCPPTNLDYECNGWPNFAGTSAAAPHVAGVAALLLQAAGGPGSLNAAQVRSLLQTTAPPRLLPYGGSTTPSHAWTIYDGFGVIDTLGALGRLPPRAP